MMKISCIIPAYNVESYIVRCISSILGQNWPATEVIAVDDGSTDGTLTVLRRLAGDDDRIRVFHQENAGQGAARNFGIAQATGEYIWFIDADDWIEQDAFAHLQRIVDAHVPEVIFTNFSKYNDQHGYAGNVIPGDFANTLLCPGKLTDDALLTLFGWKTPPFRLVTHSSLLAGNQIVFPSGLFYEDHPFSLRLLQSATWVYIDPLPIYTYYQRAGSTVHRQDARVLDFIPIRKQCLELLQLDNWSARFPSLYLSYLFPVDFYEQHVPHAFRAEFLRQLRLELTVPLSSRVEACPSANIRARGLLAAAYFRAPLLYSIIRPLERLTVRQLYGKISLVWSHCKQLIRSLCRKAFRILRNPPLAFEASLYHCHPSVDMGTCFIDVRVTRKNAPYVYAEEGASLAGRLVFEQGIGAMRFGRRSSIGGGTTMICSQAGGIDIGEHVMVSWGCTIMDSNAHSLDADTRINDGWYWHLGERSGCLGLFKDWIDVKSAPIRIDDYAWIGCNCIILGGVHIGRGAVIGAGSVVTKDVPPFTVFAGNPAQFVKLAPRRSGWTHSELLEARSNGVPQPILEAIERSLETDGDFRTRVRGKHHG